MWKFVFLWLEFLINVLLEFHLQIHLYLFNRTKYVSVWNQIRIQYTFDKAVSEEKIFRNWPTRNKNCNGSGWNEQLLHRGSAIDGSYQVSVHLAKCLQRIFRNLPTRNKNCLCRPCLLTDRNDMSILYSRSSIDASYQVLVHLSKQFQRRRFKCEKITDDGRRTPCDGKSSHGLFRKNPSVIKRTIKILILPHWEFITPTFFCLGILFILIFNIVCCEKTNFFPIIWNNLNVLRTKDIIITGNITTISPWIVSQDLELKYHNSSVVYYVVFVTLDVLSSVFDNCSLFPLV